MTFDLISRSRTRVAGSVVFLLTISLSLALVSAVCADEDSDNANNMLESLKRRSAEERWQRVKKLYPSDPPSPNRQTPSRLPDDRQNQLSESEIPPSPEQTPLIPRLPAVPVDVSNDWLRIARQPVADGPISDGAPQPSPDGVPAASDGSGNPVPSVGPPDVDSNPPTVDKIAATHSMRARDRRIADIDPYYDRSKDSDIREFATEKAKEFDIQFTPREYLQRSFPHVTLAWEASNFYFYPLYFSDPALERYGHAHHPLIQPFASIARVGAQFVLLPYQMTILPPLKPESPLGYYRPGDCTPKLHYQVPLNAEAAAVEAAALTGLFFIIVP